MHNDYTDITSRIPEPPRWYDEDAVPRYCDPSPDTVSNIYAREVAFVEIACQNCGAEFLVAFSQAHNFHYGTGKPIPWLSERVRDGTLHYGDPPNAGCCASGPTMNSEPRRVVSFWRKDYQQSWDWERVPELEIPIQADWARPANEPRTQALP